MIETLNVIGAGKLGRTLAYLFTHEQKARVQGVVNRTHASTLNALEFITEGSPYSAIANLPHANITFITTPDDAIADACQQLSLNETLQAGDIVVHCSGSLSSTILSSVKQRGCLLASVHPIRSFAEPALAITQYSGTYCAMEGDSTALQRLTPLFQSIGSITYSINSDKKPLYHAATVIGSNYLLALAQQSIDWLIDAGVDKDIAMQTTLNLMQGTVTNLESTGSTQSALTGPIQRGDNATVEKHLNAIPDLNQKQLYCLLGKKILEISKLDEPTKQSIYQLLNLTSPASGRSAGDEGI